jgi:hypothetical protein
MKLADIRRPEILALHEEGLRVEISSPRDIYDKEKNELIDILIAPTLVLSDEKDADEKFPLPIDPKMFNEDTYKRFNNFTYSIGKMVRLAELNLDTLIGVVGLYLHIYPLDEILKRNADCKELEKYDIANNFNKLTFGNLRNILSCLIKTDPELHKIKGLEDKDSRKNFTTVYKNYIEDRDFYTHGILFFLYPSMEPILRVKANTGETQYIKYEKDVFTHNLMTYNYLTTTLNEIREVLQKKITTN